MKLLNSNEISCCFGGQWAEIINAGVKGIAPVTCLCVIENSRENPMHGGLYMRSIAISSCFNSCCVKIRQQKEPRITHFVTEDASGDEFVGSCS